MAAAPTLDLTPQLKALVPAVATVVAACATDVVDSACLAAALLRFLQLKVAMNDTGPAYSMSPPLLIDDAWHALLRETPAANDVYAALGLDVIHHSACQPGGDAAHAARLRATFSAALHAAEQVVREYDAPTGRLAPLDALVWGVPERSDLLVRVTVLAPADPADAEPCPRPALHAYMPPHSSVSDLAAQLRSLYDISLERFRPLGPTSVLLHPARLLGRLPAAVAVPGGGGGHGGSTLQLFAVQQQQQQQPQEGAQSELAVAPPPPAAGTLSLSIGRADFPALDGAAPLLSLLPLLPPPDSCKDAADVGRVVYVIDIHNQPATCTSVFDDPLCVDETRPLSELGGLSLAVQWVTTPMVGVSLTVRHGGAYSSLCAGLPEAWTLADLQAWMGVRWGDLDTTTALYTDGAPAPADLSHRTAFSTLDAVVAPAPAAAAAGCTLTVRTMMGHVLTVPVDLGWTLLHLKCLVAMRTGHPVEQQRFIHAGKQLEHDEHTLAEQGMCRGSNLHMVLRLRGC